MANYRKPTLQQSIAPNATIIGLEGKVRASQTNNPVGVMNTVANSINKFMVPIMQASERRKKAADATWNKWVGQLGPDVDTEGLNAQQTEIVGLASRNLKNDRQKNKSLAKIARSATSTCSWIRKRRWGSRVAPP